MHTQGMAHILKASQAGEVRNEWDVEDEGQGQGQGHKPVTLLIETK